MRSVENFMLFKKKEKKIDPYSMYVDPTGEFPNTELEAAQWYLKHQAFLSRVGTGALVLFCVMSIGYSLYRWAEYAIVGYAEQRRLITAQSVSFFDVARSSQAIVPVQFGDVRVFQSASGRYDFYANAANRNAVMIAIVSFHYVFSDGQTPVQETVVLPQRDMPLVAYGIPASHTPSAASLVVDRVSWQRVNPHSVKDVGEYIGSRLRFDIEALSFSPAYGSDGIPANQVAFDVVNASAYSYWQAVFTVVFFDGDSVTGVVPLSLDRFHAGERRHVAFGTLISDVRVRSITVFPDIRIFDRSVFIPPGTE